MTLVRFYEIAFSYLRCSFLFIMIPSLLIGTHHSKKAIIQGGMGVGISLHRLASAVANEGGIGVISAAGLGLIHRKLSKDYLEASKLGLEKEIRLSREMTQGVLGVNIMVAMTNFADMVRCAIEQKVDILFAGAGLPLDLPSYKPASSNTALVPIVSSARAAKLIIEKWKQNYNYLPDAIVVEGPKAGGHLGFKTSQIEDARYQLESLIPEVITEIQSYEKLYNQKIPVIAAGGIYTGQDIRQYFQLGASGVQLGTLFVTTHECDAAMDFKMTYIHSKQEDIQLIESPVGMPGRAIRNSFLESVERGEKKPIQCPVKCIKTCDVDKTPYCIISALMNSYKGNMNAGYAFAGANAYRANHLVSVAEVFERLNGEYEQNPNSLMHEAESYSDHCA